MRWSNTFTLTVSHARTRAPVQNLILLAGLQAAIGVVVGDDDGGGLTP